MPDSESGIHRIVPDKGDSPHRRREKVIVLATILLVVIAVLTLMRRGSNASPDGGSVDSTGNDYTGGPDASGAGGGNLGAQLPGEIGSIPQQTSALLNTNLQNKLTNARARLQNTRKGRTKARQRAQKEHKTIVRQRHEISKLKHHPAHTGKKNGEHWKSIPPKKTKTG